MTTRKTATKTTRKSTRKNAMHEMASKSKARTKRRQAVAKKTAAEPRNRPEETNQQTYAGGGPTAPTGPSGIRVRMYRVGFGDFFLLTVPGKSGPAHILIDCGVHAKDIGSMGDCVQDMKKETGGKLALVILTHYHADHMSGFAKNYDDFAQFEVGRVWITNRLDPSNGEAAKLMAQLTSVAQQLKMQLGARQDEVGMQGHDKVSNALGVASEDGGGGANAKALKLLQSGFKNKPPVDYYQGGDTAVLPDELENMLTAEILSPSPKDSGGEFAASDNKTEQYLAALGEDGVPEVKQVLPFNKEKWPGSAADYPANTFDEFDSGIFESRKRKGDGAENMEKSLTDMQPDALAAAADKLDGTLNNQSLVVLFTCKNKKLLFVGDAQWGNWAHWLYGKAVSGKDPGISDRAKEILGSIDFYKVGHHGSTNATPIPAAAALGENCASMCSTATGAYGSPARKTEVPRTALMEALEEQTRSQLVRSDWIAAGNTPFEQEAHDELPKLPAGFSTPGELYIDYNL